MKKIPLTREIVSSSRQNHIKSAVQHAKRLTNLGRIATQDDTNSLFNLLRDPLISEPIYTLPQIISVRTVSQFIGRHIVERNSGDGLLMLNVSDNGVVKAYYDIQVWPQWGACELGGAVHRDYQSEGRGGADAQTIFDWMFSYLGVKLICETCAVDNIRTTKLLERIGFKAKGEITSSLQGGGTRQSLYWELAG